MKSYLRFLSRNKLYAAIEVMGLSLALGFIIILASYAKTEFSVGTKQPLSKEIYVIGQQEGFGMTLGTAEEFFPSIPEIKSWTRLADYGDIDITVDGEYYKAPACALDTNFLKLFDYRLIGCDKNRILPSSDQVIISESFAKKAFGGDDPIGRTVSHGGKDLIVSGVLQDFEVHDVFQYCDVFLSMEAVKNMVHRMDQFGSVHTFLTLADGAKPEAVADKLLDKYCEYWDFYNRDASKGGFIYGSSLTRLDKMYFSGFETYDMIRTGDKNTVEMLILVVLVLLVSAIFNYINLTVAQAGKRAREMATRMLMGESRSGILRRYVFESFIFTLGCFILGCMIAATVHPLMCRLLSTDESLLHADWFSVIIASVLIAAVSLISGLLPAMISSRFEPIDVVKGNYRLRSKMLFSRVFIICQNVISTVLIAVALTMTLQMRYLVNIPYGYNTKDIIELQTGALGYRNFNVQNELASRLRALPQVEEVGMYTNSPFHSSNNGIHGEDGQMMWMSVTSLDSISFNILGFKVLEQYSAPLNGLYWFTEDAQRRYGITEQNRTAGRMIDGVPEYECCGIVADFRTHDALNTPFEDTHNVVMLKNDLCAGMLIKTIGDRMEAFEAVSRTWQRMAKEYLGIPIETRMTYIDDQLSESLTSDRNTMMLVCIFMVLSILISTLGLFAMSVYYSDQQKKAISLHKIFGADIRQAVLKLSRQFVVSSLLAIAIATPISIRLMEHYLEGFYNRIAFPWWALVASGMLSFIISVLCILSQTLKTASANPVESIKSE